MMEEDCWRDLQIVFSQLSGREAKLADEVRRSALNYGHARGRWQLANTEERKEIDHSRTIAHDRFIDACNALSRACARLDFQQEWRRAWGDARTGEPRKRIGDFACFIAYRLMLEAR